MQSSKKTARKFCLKTKKDPEENAIDAARV